jgi:hypothetical protein
LAFDVPLKGFCGYLGTETTTNPLRSCKVLTGGLFVLEIIRISKQNSCKAILCSQTYDSKQNGSRGVKWKFPSLGLKSAFYLKPKVLHCFSSALHPTILLVAKLTISFLFSQKIPPPKKVKHINANEAFENMICGFVSALTRWKKKMIPLPQSNS